MFGFLKDAMFLATRSVNRATTLVRNGRRALFRARIIHQTQEWDSTAQRWIKRVAPAAWFDVMGRWIRSEVHPASEAVYTVAAPMLTGQARPRVMHVMPNVYVGGSTQLVVDLHDHLGDRYEMEVITSELPKSGQHQGIVIHRHASPANPERLATLLRARKPDLIHVHYWGSTDTPWYDAVFAAAGANGAMVLQNINTPVAPYRHPTVAMNVFVSNTIRALGAAGDPPGRVIYPGIDLRRFQPRPFEDRAEDSIGMVYRLEPDKLNLQSIDPFIAVVQRRPRTRVYIIGDGTFFTPYVLRAKAAGVFNNIVFTGAVPYAQLPAWYARFKVFVAPVWQESFGQVTPFAMAMGLGVAGHRIGALPEILDGDETLGTGLDDTVNRIIGLLDDPMRLARIAAFNRERANRLFSVQAMTAAYDEVYAGLVEPAGTVRVAGSG